MKIELENDGPFYDCTGFGQAVKDISMKGIFMEKSLKKRYYNKQASCSYIFILIFAALMVIISAVAPMSNHEPKTMDTYSDFFNRVVKLRGV